MSPGAIRAKVAKLKAAWASGKLKAEFASGDDVVIETIFGGADMKRIEKDDPTFHRTLESVAEALESVAEAIEEIEDATEVVDFGIALLERLAGAGDRGPALALPGREDDGEPTEVGNDTAALPQFVRSPVDLTTPVVDPFERPAPKE